MRLLISGLTFFSFQLVLQGEKLSELMRLARRCCAICDLKHLRNLLELLELFVGRWAVLHVPVRQRRRRLCRSIINAPVSS